MCTVLFSKSLKSRMGWPNIYGKIYLIIVLNSFIGLNPDSLGLDSLAGVRLPGFAEDFDRKRHHL